MNDNLLLNKNDDMFLKSETDKMIEDLRGLSDEINNKEMQINVLTDAINQANAPLIQCQSEIETRESTIGGLLEDKEKLSRETNDFQKGFPNIRKEAMKK